ncbi:metalloregulator ArsR/SmtB family transcription factor [Hoeflea sp. YIM 152468]|uniref:ArsR/SmtB family transcription factor n=1 Tax=Hoeflea sp. YIM 152468 TaxID=3031759 RepID=UPI0023DA7F3F|nr:metalloregulator ArsR/SmtB family transcription factor [Hoeflea sp. YIM 152468]MDF1607248.1 metalloregulator ArsR/SmtB family transcription factor [Hoeflea sp. YIM 152468]
MMKTDIAVKILAVLAHEGRVSLLQTLVQAGEQGSSVGTLAGTTGQKLKTVSAQLQLMADAGLVRVRREGKQMIYCAQYDTLGALFAFIMHDCCGGHEGLRRTVQRACEC